MDIKMDGENMYIKAPVLNYLLLGMNGDDSSELTAALPAAGEDIWYKMPMSWIFDTYEDMGIDFEQLLLMAQNVNSFEGYLNMLAGYVHGSGRIRYQHILHAQNGSDSFK